MKNIRDIATTSASNLKHILSEFCLHSAIPTDANDDTYEAIGQASMSLVILEALAKENPINQELLSEAIEAANGHSSAFELLLKETSA